MALGRGLDSLIPRRQAPTTLPTAGASGGVPPVATPTHQVHELRLEQIQVNPHQPRKRFDMKELHELVDSIKKYGVIQPVIVTRHGDGYQLIAGERRLRASRLAGKETIPAMVREAQEQEKMEIALIENIQRKNLNPLEEAISYARLMHEFNLTQEEVAQRVGKSRSAVANTVRILNLPDQIKDAIMDERISEGHARALVSLDDEQAQLALANKILENRLSVRETEAQVRTINVGNNKRVSRRDPVTVEQEERLTKALGTRVQIKKKGDRGEIVIPYDTMDDFRNIFDRIQGS